MSLSRVPLQKEIFRNKFRAREVLEEESHFGKFGGKWKDAREYAVGPTHTPTPRGHCLLAGWPPGGDAREGLKAGRNGQLPTELPLSPPLPLTVTPPSWLVPALAHLLKDERVAPPARGANPISNPSLSFEYFEDDR